VVLVCKFEEGEMAINPSTWDANVKRIVEILLELGESFLETFFRRDIDPS
jgi:hypothetical protein